MMSETCSKIQTCSLMILHNGRVVHFEIYASFYFISQKIYYRLSGHYLYLEASRHYQKTAKLDSPSYPAGQYCFSAYFHMYGQQTGYLSFKLIQHGHPYTIKRYTGDHGNRWLHLRLSINIHATFQVS